VSENKKLKPIDEETVRTALKILGPNSSFKKALDLAETYREAGLTPIFLCDDDNRMIYVVTEERMKNVFH
jgi:hypothetical protein